MDFKTFIQIYEKLFKLLRDNLRISYLLAHQVGLL